MTTLAPDRARTYDNPLRIPPRSILYEQRDPREMRWADLSPLVSFPADGWNVHVDAQRAPWRFVRDDDVDH